MNVAWRVTQSFRSEGHANLDFNPHSRTESDLSLLVKSTLAKIAISIHTLARRVTQ